MRRARCDGRGANPTGRSTRRRRGAKVGRMRFLLALPIGFLCCATAAQAADPVDVLRARRHTPAGQAVELRTHAHWDANCRAGTDPRISWVVEPAHGKVTEAAGSVSGHAPAVGATDCSGVEMHGLRLTYQPEPGYIGTDTLSYDVRYDARNPVVRYEFRIVVEPGPPN